MKKRGGGATLRVGTGGGGVWVVRRRVEQLYGDALV